MSFRGNLEQHGILVDGTGAQLRTFASGGNLVRPSPGQGFWKDCPNLNYVDPSVAHSFFDDFGSIALDDTTLLPTQYVGVFDATGSIACGSTTGGVVNLTTHTDANDAVSLQLGLGRFPIVTDSGKKLWAEFRISTASAAATIAGAFVGLASAGYDFDILTDTTGVLAASKNLLGFRIIAATPAAWQACWKTGSQTVGTVAACVNAADYHTFGIYFDGKSTVTFYVDRVPLGTTVETDATAFPTGMVGTPFFAIKTVSGDAKVLSLDWVKVVQVR